VAGNGAELAAASNPTPLFRQARRQKRSNNPTAERLRRKKKPAAQCAD